MTEIDHKRVFNILNPPEAIEIVAECRINRYAMASPISNPERYVKEEICREIARELMKRDLVEILCQDQPINDSIVFHAKVKVFERGYKLKILV
jgi:hypothetical protein